MRFETSRECSYAYNLGVQVSGWQHFSRVIENRGKHLSILLFVSGLAIVLIRSYDSQSKAPFVLLNQVRIGSKLEDLNYVFSNEQLIRSAVITECKPSETCKVKDIGNFYDSNILETRDDFSGRVVVFVERPFLSNSIALSFEFSSGVLTKKDWGFMPG